MEKRILDIDKFRETLNIQNMDRDEADCIVFAWLLKTKLYLLGETSHKWSERGKGILKHELEIIVLEDWQP